MSYVVELFTNQKEAFKVYQQDDKTPYCFGITFAKFDLINDDYEVEFHF